MSALKIQYVHSVTENLNYTRADMEKCWQSPKLLREDSPIVLGRIRITGFRDPD